MNINKIENSQYIDESKIICDKCKENNKLNPLNSKILSLSKIFTNIKDKKNFIDAMHVKLIYVLYVK